MPKYLSCVAFASMVIAAAPVMSTANADGFEPRGFNGSLKDAPVYVPYSWAGFYFGGHIGGGRLDADVDVIPEDIDEAETDFFDPDAIGVLGGLSAGYNFQFGRHGVVGIEGDWTWTDLSDRVDAPFEFEDGIGTTHASVGIDWLASLRARLGLANDRALFYLTGGIAWADLNLEGGANGEVDDEFFDFHADDDNTETGWVVGGGIEYAVTRNFIIGAEYLYYQFDDAQVSAVNTLDELDGTITYAFDDLRVNSFRATGKYKF